MFDLFDTPIDRTSEIKIPKEYHVERLDVLIGKRYFETTDMVEWSELGTKLSKVGKEE